MKPGRKLSLQIGLIVAVNIAALIGLVACTIVPKPAPAGAVPNGWLTNVVPGVSGHLSGEGHEAYNLLIPIYGKKFLPPLVPNAGVSAINPADGSCTLDYEHCVDFGMMVFWRDNPQQVPP